MRDAEFDYRSEAFAFAEDVGRMSDPTAIMQRMLRVTRGLGLEGLTVGGLPHVGERFHLTLATQLPEEWHVSYIERGLFFVDPVARRLESAVRPFQTSAADYGSFGEARAREVMEGRETFGQIDGYVVPVPRPAGKGYVWMSGARPELPPGFRPALHLMALYAFDRISGLLKPHPAERRELTRREREVLTWVALGKTAWEIGEILSIAKRTVDEHTRSAAQKLGAVNRTQAVAVALRDRRIAI